MDCDLKKVNKRSRKTRSKEVGRNEHACVCSHGPTKCSQHSDMRRPNFKPVSGMSLQYKHCTAVPCSADRVALLQTLGDAF